MTQPGPFLAGQRVRANQINEAVRRCLQSVEAVISGTIASGIGGTETNITDLAVGPVDLVSGALYRFDLRATLQNSVGTDEFALRIRRDTPVTGPLISEAIAYGPRHTGGYSFVTWREF